MSPPSEASSTSGNFHEGHFLTTHWGVVLQAGQADSHHATEALEYLCRAYWYPLYAYVRRQGHPPHDAEDLTQEFFSRLLEKEYLRNADQNRGRFRTFLLSSLKNFLINEWKKANRGKRGGGRRILSLDADETETRFRAEPADDRTPEKAFDRRWALLVLGRVLDRLQAELVAEGRGPLFDEIKSFLTAADKESSYGEIGKRLGMTVANLKVTVHRLRRRYRELMKKEVAMTVEDSDQVDEEIRELIAALGG